MLSDSIVETFQGLLDQARQAGDPDPTAMNLATTDATGRVSARIVLLKAFDARGPVFYTNLESTKGRQIAANPQAALCFHWKPLRDGVQVRFEGRLHRVDEAEADQYFASRPRESQIGAWASLQSETLEQRSVFEQRYASFETRFSGAAIPRPPHWSGLRLDVDMVEFWYGMPYRLHERQRHELRSGVWSSRLLYP